VGASVIAGCLADCGRGAKGKEAVLFSKKRTKKLTAQVGQRRRFDPKCRQLQRRQKGKRPQITQITLRDVAAEMDKAMEARFPFNLRNLCNLWPLGFRVVVHDQRVLKNEPQQRPKPGQLPKKRLSSGGWPMHRCC
jgi:hypothetical protein